MCFDPVSLSLMALSGGLSVAGNVANNAAVDSANERAVKAHQRTRDAEMDRQQQFRKQAEDQFANSVTQYQQPNFEANRQSEQDTRAQEAAAIVNQAPVSVPNTRADAPSIVKSSRENAIKSGTQKGLGTSQNRAALDAFAAALGNANFGNNQTRLKLNNINDAARASVGLLGHEMEQAQRTAGAPDTSLGDVFKGIGQLSAVAGGRGFGGPKTSAQILAR